ncbi:MAG: corrinoid protein [Oscillospiraceae bacterium]|nr:corrinoid protein [Oscillospiraceae bacterium]
MSDILLKISEELQNGKAKIVKQLVEDALTEGISAQDILNNGLMAGLDIIAVKFKNNEVYVPEVLVAARAMNMGTSVLKPHLTESGAKPIGKALLGTVRGDLHDIGKNLVKIMFEGKGIEVIDLGVDVPPEEFVRAQKEHNADIIALSALLTTTMEEMKVVVDAFTEAGLRDDVIIMIGGAPVNEGTRESSGADIYAEDAATGAELAMSALGARKG